MRAAELRELDREGADSSAGADDQHASPLERAAGGRGIRASQCLERHAARLRQRRGGEVVEVGGFRHEGILARGHDFGEAAPARRRELAEDGVSDAVAGHLGPDGDDRARDIRPDHPMLRPEWRGDPSQCRADHQVDIPGVERDGGHAHGDLAGAGHRSRQLGEAHDLLGLPVAIEHDGAHALGCGGHGMIVSSQVHPRFGVAVLAKGPGVRQAARMRKPVLITVGAIVALMGVIFMFQGLGVIGGSAMTGSTLWAILGPIIALGGIVLVVFGLRRKS